MNVLLLEDDVVIAKEICSFLRAKGMNCDVAYDGELFFRHLRSTTYQLYILDINVPKINGLDVCRRIRSLDPVTPIIMSTAYEAIEEKVEAFQGGADDYLVKPFLLEELYVRLQALLRRQHIPQQSVQTLIVDDLIIDEELKTVTRQGTTVRLTPKEFQLLTILARGHGKVISKRKIADSLWDHHVDTNEKTIEVYINFLRNKVDKPFGRPLIHTKIGFGYYLSEQE